MLTRHMRLHTGEYWLLIGCHKLCRSLIGCHKLMLISDWLMQVTNRTVVKPVVKCSVDLIICQHINALTQERSLTR